MPKQYYLVHPGEILQETLEALGMTQAELAERIDLAKETINNIVRGKDNITPETAAKLSRAFGTSLEMWLNLQAHYEVAKQNDLADKRAATEAKQFGALSFYDDLLRLEHVPKADNKAEKVKNLWSFFGVDSLTYLPKVQEVAFRKKITKACTDLALAAWLRCGEKDALKADAAPFDREELTRAMESIRKLTTKSGDIKLAEIAAPLSKAGVVLVKTPAFNGLGVSAATRWLDSEKALIQLSERGGYADVIWFSLFHEIGHLMKHGKKARFVELDGSDKPDTEREADEFAAEALISRAQWRGLGGVPYHRTNAELLAFAKKLGVDPGIVAGRYARESGGCYAAVAKLRRKAKIV